MVHQVAVYLDEELAKYGFGQNHPFSHERYFAFSDLFMDRQLENSVTLKKGRQATYVELNRFHTSQYLDFVKDKSEKGTGYLDYGDTPAEKGIYEAASYVVGTVLDGVDQIMKGSIKKVFVPIAGLHHGAADTASGFCVFNDCAIAIRTLRQVYGLQKIAYIDIDVHHGDGVYYAFESDPKLIFADIHQEGIFPGTGGKYEKGKGPASGRKLNIPLLAGSNDEDFQEVWPQVEELMEREEPEFFILQCGADSLAQDPLSFLNYSSKTHGFVAQRICKLADQYAKGRVLALGGGGYNLNNIAQAWVAVVESLIQSTNS